MVDSGKTFGVSDEEITPGNQVLCETSDEVFLSLTIEIDHDIAAKYDLKFFGPRVGFEEVDASEVNFLADVWFYPAVTLHLIFAFLKVFTAPFGGDVFDFIEIVDSLGGEF